MEMGNRIKIAKDIVSALKSITKDKKSPEQVCCEMGIKYDKFIEIISLFDDVVYIEPEQLKYSDELDQKICEAAQAITIDKLGLDTRSFRLCYHHLPVVYREATLYDLLIVPNEELASWRGCGKLTIKDINSKLEEFLSKFGINKNMFVKKHEKDFTLLSNLKRNIIEIEAEKRSIKRNREKAQKEAEYLSWLKPSKLSIW